jgi:hypothetical protein
MQKFTQKALDFINAIESADERFKFTKMLEKAANRFARKHGNNAATKIDIRLDSRDVLKEQEAFGYVKDTTGEYVPRSYVTKCRGKGVSYKHVVCEVQIGIRDLALKA